MLSSCSSRYAVHCCVGGGPAGSDGPRPRERFWQSDGTRITAELNGYAYTLLTMYIISHPAAGHKSLSNSYLGNLQIIELLRQVDRFVVEVR